MKEEEGGARRTSGHRARTSQAEEFSPELYSETGSVSASNLFGTGSLWELQFHKPIACRILSLNKPIKK